MDPQTSSSAPEAQAITVGGYQVLGRLAVGGMSELFLAEERVGGEALRYVVIKLLPATDHVNGMPQPDAEELFLREGRTLLRLDHPNVCHSYAFGTTGTRRYIAMEWIDGVSLRELIIALRDQSRGIDFHLSANLIAQVAAGLEHAHTARDAQRTPLRVVHRDVNPTNVMIRYDGVVKLIDFGVAQVAERISEVNVPLVRGKLAYMAPEQVRGAELDHRADIFALGVCLYELLTGTRLYRRGSAQATAGAVLEEEVPSPRAVDPNVPEALDEVVRRALQKDPAARFASAAELQAALEDYLVKAGQGMGARPLAALMGSAFPGAGGQPKVEALVDIAERFSDPGPLPSATSPRNETVRPAEPGDDDAVTGKSNARDLDVSGLVPTEPVSAIERAASDSPSEGDDERPTQLHPRASARAPARSARPVWIVGGLCASAALVALVWSSAGPAQDGALAREKPPVPRVEAPAPAAPHTPPSEPPARPPALSSSSIAGEEPVAGPPPPGPASAPALGGATTAPDGAPLSPTPERKARARKPRSSPGFIADPGF